MIKFQPLLFLAMVLAATTFSVYPLIGQTAIVHNEGVDGDLSSILSSPTIVGTLTLGSNEFVGSGYGFGLPDRVDAFTFNIDEGQVLKKLAITEYAPDFFSTGSLFLVSGVDGSGPLIISALCGPIPNFCTNLDLLVALQTGPQGEGAYTLYWQFLGGSPIPWEMELTVSEVPVPAAIWLFGTVIFGLVGYSNRRATNSFRKNLNRILS